MKQLIIKSALLAAALIMPGKSLAYDFMVDGIAYNILSESTCEVTSYIVTNQNRYGGDITIPEQVTYDGVTRTVTQIGDDAFNECIRLTSVDIPNSVTTIGDYAFGHCSKKLKNVNIGNSVTTIGYALFEGCTGLTSVEISNSVTTIESYAFYGCTSLASIEIPNSVTTIGSSAFHGCTSLVSIDFPNTVTTIERSTFNGCTSLMGFDFPNSVAVIGDYAFQDCKGFTSIVIPNSVTTIGEGAFSGCSNIRELVFEDNEEELILDWMAFSGCSFAKLYVGRNLTCKQTVYGYLINFIYLTDVTIGNLVTDVTAILWDMNKNLASIKSLATTPPTTREFTDTQYRNVTVSVPAGSLDKYKEHDIWKKFSNIREDTPTGIGNVDIPDGQDIKVENGNIVVDNAKGRVSVYDVAARW